MRDKVQLSPDKLFGFSIQPRLRSLDVFNEHTHPIPLHTPTPPKLFMRNIVKYSGPIFPSVTIKPVEELLRSQTIDVKPSETRHVRKRVLCPRQESWIKLFGRQKMELMRRGSNTWMIVVHLKKKHPILITSYSPFQIGFCLLLSVLPNDRKLTQNPMGSA